MLTLYRFIAAVVAILFPGPLVVQTSLGGGTSVVQGLFSRCFRSIFSFPRPPCVSKTCRGSILPQCLPEIGNTDSEIINSRDVPHGPVSLYDLYVGCGKAQGDIPRAGRDRLVALYS